MLTSARKSVLPWRVLRVKIGRRSYAQSVLELDMIPLHQRKLLSILGVSDLGF